MFDDIVYKAACPMCRTELTGWQSKDGDCCLARLSAWELWNQSRSEIVQIYTDCGVCGTWVEISLSSGTIDFTTEERAAAMDEAKSQGGGLREYHQILGRERRGPEPPPEIQEKIAEESRQRAEEDGKIRWGFR